MRVRLAALMLALAATGAGAQTPSPGMGQPTTDPAADAFVQGGGTGLRGSKLSGVDVIDLDYKRVGNVKDVLIGRDGRVQAVIVGVGGVLGIGEKDVAIRFEHFLWNTGESATQVGPSASMSPERAPPQPDSQQVAERMPGAQVNQDVLQATPLPSPVNPASGPATTGSTPPATAIAGDGEPHRAQVRLTREQIEKAPTFRYDAGR
jgi:sporulation protein YlmC with PRC-barrel domain